MHPRVIYHGSTQLVETPEIRPTRYHKDFGPGFYGTLMKEQAIRWATRFSIPGFVNEFTYQEQPDLIIRRFETMTEEWLDFITHCRHGGNHDADIVEGPMADDSIFNYVQDFIDGTISRKDFWELAAFKRPTNQLCFHSTKALQTLTFKGYEIHEP